MIAASKNGNGKKPVKSETAEAYAKRLQWQTEKNAAATRAARDFGKLPKVKNSRRKARCKKSLEKFCRTYLGSAFALEFSDDHLEVISDIERAVLNGGLFALAMPRGSGKTTITEAAALWAIIYGHRRFVYLIGATDKLAGDLLESIRTELETNDLLLADFPEVCLPIRKLEGISTRKLYCDGNRVRLKLASSEIVLPWYEGGRNGPAAGAIVATCGITGAIRGAKKKQRDGTVIRPDFVIPDDPQTDEAARSAAQVATLERTVGSAILGLAGPGKKIAGVMPCTVIAEGDLADRILNRDIHPEWNGKRIAFLKSFPDDLDLWDQYNEARTDSLREFGDIRKATAFYKKHREKLDAGAVVYWSERFDDDEVSAVQHAMNKRFSDVSAFWSEYQNDPRESSDEELRLLPAKEIAKKSNGLDRLSVPSGAEWITGFIDVQQRALWYALVGVRADFTSGVIDYGTFPDQGRRYYSMADITKTIPRQYPRAGVDAGILKAIGDLSDFLSGRTYVRENDGVEMFPNLVLVDANWKTSVVRDAVRLIGSPAYVAAHGRFVGASSTPVQEFHKKRGERVGHYWKTSAIERLTHVLFDANYWKSFLHDRIGIEFGDPGSLTFWGREADQHRMVAEHLVAEYRVRVSASNGRVVDEWKTKSGKPDNHLLDCLSGSMVAASVMGAKLAAMDKKPSKAPKRRRTQVSF